MTPYTRNWVRHLFLLIFKNQIFNNKSTKKGLIYPLVSKRFMKLNLLYACICLLLIGTIQKMNFERNIFVYWETGIANAPLTVRVSYEKLEFAAQNSGWKVHLITGSNIKDFLPEYDHFQWVVGRGHRQTVQQKSDILRVHLIEEHGGVWLDFVTILYQNLDWLQDDSLFQQLIINRIGTNTDDPDMLMIGEGWHQSPYSYYNSENRLVCEQYFGTAIHFMAAKRKSPVMKAWKITFDKMVTMRFQEMMPGFLQKRIYVKNIDSEDVYLSGNMAYEETIQEKQFELDDKLSLWNIFTPRQNVYEHFKIWQLHGEVGPIALTRSHAFIVQDLFFKTKQEAEQVTGKLWFYLKFPGWVRRNVQDYQSRAEKYFRKNPNLNIQTILKNIPTNEECQFFYIVKGSILHKLYENSQYMDEIKTPFITVQQRQQLRSYCTQKNPGLYNPRYRASSVGQVTKLQRQVIYANMTSFTEKLSLIKTFYKGEFESGYRKWLSAYEAIYVYLILRNLICLVKFIVSFVKSKIIKCQTANKPSLQSLKEYVRLSHIKKIVTDNLTKDQFFSFSYWIGLNVLSFVLLYAKSVMFAVNYQFYDEVTGTGKLGQWSNLFIIISINIFLDLVIGKFIHNKNSNTFIGLQTILKETRVFVYLPLGYVAILHMDIVYGFAYFHAMNIVGGGLLVYVWLEEIKARKIGFVWLDKIEFVLSKGKWVLLGLFLVYRMNRNIRYLRFNHHYLKEYIVEMLNSGFWVLLYSLAVIAVGFFVYKLFFMQCTKPQEQSQVEKNRKTLSKANICHSLITLIIILLVSHTTNAIYQSKLNYPYMFPYIQLFRIMLPLYSLCAALIRLSVSTKIFSLYWILTTILSIFPLMYWYVGLQFYNWFQNRGQMKEFSIRMLVIIFVIVEQFRVSINHSNQQLNHQNYMDRIEPVESQSDFIYEKENLKINL